MITNYAEMVDAITSWLNRAGLTTLGDQIPNFIAFGQRRIMYECDLKAMEDFVSPFTIDGQTVALPDPFLRIRSIMLVDALGTSQLQGALLARVLNYKTLGRPQFYCTRGTNIVFGPSPDREYTAILDYYAPIPILSDTVTTNWFTDNYPELLLAASLYEALLWLKDDQRAQVWAAQYQRLKQTLENSESRIDMPYGQTAGARLS